MEPDLVLVNQKQPRAKSKKSINTEIDKHLPFEKDIFDKKRQKRERITGVEISNAHIITTKNNSFNMSTGWNILLKQFMRNIYIYE
jgi:hypothetical protein